MNGGMRMPPFFFMLLLIASPASARLGETVQECLARYGEAIEADAEERTAAFVKSGFLVMVYFDDSGYCDKIIFIREDKEAFSETQKDTLIAANLGEEIEPVDVGINEGWETPTGDLGVYNVIQEVLIFRTKARLERDAKEKESKEKKALSDF